MGGAAGWYDDPGGSGDQRWWDGTAWTQHRRRRPASVLEQSPEERRRRNRRAWAWIAAGGVALAGMAALASSIGVDEGEASHLDPLGRSACYGAYELSRDADLLTDAEIRERVQDIYDDARYSDVPGVAPAARRLLAAATSVDVDAFSAAASDLAESCNPPTPTTG